MRTSPVSLFATAFLAVAVVALSVPLLADADTEHEKEQERQVTLEQLPPPVKTTVLKQAGEHSILELEEVRIGEKIYYEAEWMEGDLEVEIQIAPDGTLLGRSTEEPDDEGNDDDDGEDQGDAGNDDEEDDEGDDDEDDGDDEDEDEDD
jgi:hypothetical protein